MTDAGPLESNHNFGGAVDLGFDGLRWLRANGTVCEDEGWWLNKLTAIGGGQADIFWAAMRAAGVAVGAFHGPIYDRPHLQNWSDAGVSMAARLAALLTASGTMRWEGRRGVYSCDLGFGGALVPVGSAVQIWAENATITAADIQRLQAAAAMRRGAPAAVATPARPAARTTPAARGATPVGIAAVAAMKRALRVQFERADANWRAWTAR